MTTQIGTTLIVGDREEKIIGVKAKRFFDPRSLGLEFEYGSTCCWDGFYLNYEILGAGLHASGERIFKLFLHSITGYNLKKNKWTETYPWFDGRPPDIIDGDSGNARYGDLEYFVPLTGSLFTEPRARDSEYRLFEYQFDKGVYSQSLDQTVNKSGVWRLIHSNDIASPTSFKASDTFGWPGFNLSHEDKLGLGEQILRGTLTAKVVISMFPSLSPKDVFDKLIMPKIEAMFEESFGDKFRL